ncbi:MAG: hypothetical protein Q8M26_11745 [Pseudolabrys sp.]|nr:hypothetical protein [Pseudolabrys sp.]
MPILSQTWGNIHPSVFSETTNPLKPVPATLRPHGAVRYQCPATDSLVLVTDEKALADIARPRARIRCVDCGEMHLLIRDDAGSPIIVPGRPAA